MTDMANEIKMMFEEDKDVLYNDKSLFVSNLLTLLHQTREGSRIVNMYLDKEDMINILFKGGHTKQVNVHMDSYLAITKDVLKVL